MAGASRPTDAEAPAEARGPSSTAAGGTRVQIGSPEHPDAPDLLHGGLLYRLMSRFGVDPEQAARAARRAALAGLLLWLPMAALALFEGSALPGRARVPMLYDVAAYVRPLVVVPLLLVAEPILARSWREVGRLLHERGIVADECHGRYDALVAKVTGSVRGVLPEIVCALLAAALTSRLVATAIPERSDWWFAATDASGAAGPSMAGLWSAYVVHLAIVYLTLRWIWLLLLWYRFLFGVSRLPLRTLPAHPDRAAGLGVIGRSLPANAPLLLAWSASLACAVANSMIHGGQHLSAFAPVGVVLLVFVLLLFVAPPVLIFLPVLVRTRVVALEDWGRRMGRCAEEARLSGTGGVASPVDASREDSLQDLQVAVDSVRAILPVPVTLGQLAVVVGVTAAPAVPLLFLAFSASEIFDRIVRLVL